MKKSTRLKLLTLFVVALLSSCKDDAADQEPSLPEGQVDIAIVDQAVEAFMTKHNVPGLSLAVTKDEKLVYVKAYGKADRESDQNVTTESLFRIASVSKSITGIAMMKLVEEGKLSLDDKVFGAGGILGTTYGTKPYSAQVQNITVKHLLHHTAGGWGNQNNDPMFTNPTMTADQLITWTLDNRPLQRAPGAAYDYSNFGYSILGRIVEKVSGKTYENYVKDAILTPSGITRMSNGGNTLADRKPGEVKYYGTNGGGPDPYAYNIARMDAHGGWIASAKDLVKLLVHADGFPGKQDVISAASVDLMTTAPSLANPSHYACGWSVSNNQWWHLGSLPGTVSELGRNGNNRVNGAILVNTRDGGQFVNDLDVLLWNTIIRNQAIQWQDIDQF